MMYWGLTKLEYNPRQTYHKMAETFLEKAIDKMLADNKTPYHPIPVFDQIFQASAVMLNSNS